MLFGRIEGAEHNQRHVRRQMRLGFLVGTVIALASGACAGDGAKPRDGSMELKEMATPAGSASWDGLEKPTAIKVAQDGSVYVADNGDGHMHVFDRDGQPIREFGAIGSGPGEYRNIRAFSVSANDVDIFDVTPTRFIKVSMQGTRPRTRPFPGSGDDQVVAFGDGSLVLASTARWAVPSRPGTPAWPLARIVDSLGTIVADIGEREAAANPFVGHIRNFVLPAGSQDGEFVWLAYLNSPDVLLYSTADKSTKRIARTLPFVWTRLANDFMPSMLAPQPGRPTIPPFDVITYGIDADADGRAFVLTALESSQLANGEPTAMAVDVIDSRFPESLLRLKLHGYHTHLAVSPHGDRLYLLNATTGVILMYEVPK